MTTHAHDGPPPVAPDGAARARPTVAYLTLADVVDRYGGAYSAWTVREKCRRGEMPHVRHPGSKPILFRADWLDEWDAGAPLERRVTRRPGLSPGRVVRPRDVVGST